MLGTYTEEDGYQIKKFENKIARKETRRRKPFGGRRRVTDSAIADSQKCYGLAIRRNLNNLQGMRERERERERERSISIYYHPMKIHIIGLCPKGAETKTKGECYKHVVTYIPRVVVEEMKPIFRDVREPELLKKCLHGRTQNPNESVNSVIWNRLPRTTFIGVRTLHFGVWDAVASFNEGNLMMCHVYERLGFPSGRNCV
ncbi:hypothetical protein PR048_013450 [Dryococelus australis]|uniref:Uncharacterized protein n=1 Tax=Dryococelus australis TaxID=614101 RepID=A0ABQ9HS69_9NEOP|nr:hypothetical protein PR048_013450 [Dryococelus australis]